ncbi:MAG: DegT/DnrJ/EryC1/StrS family aminotransferase, partial [Candidatus Edwardsbacteria bacterium]|nr:DegT/DnrJ/EryC1/StrS family aminotransferase [Candidatus Edwardsbacteria bacterium]
KPRFRHEVAGYNFRMTGYQAALGLAQFRKIEQIIAEKRRVAGTYNRCLAGRPGIQTPAEAEWARNVYWMYALTIKPEFGLSRDQLAQRLADHGIETRTFFCPMNQQPVLRSRPGFRDVSCPVADRLWETGIYLPSAINLTEAQIESICGSLLAATGAPRL